MKFSCVPHPAPGRAGRLTHTGLRPGIVAEPRPRGFVTLRAGPRSGSRTATRSPVPPGAPGE